MKLPGLPVASFLFLLLTSPVSGQDWELQIKEFPHIAYPLEVEADNQTAHCTAVVVADDIVLTAAHCIPEDWKTASVAVDGLHATVAKRNAVIDLAILKVDGLNGRPIVLRKTPIGPGISISVIGYGFAAHHLKYGFGWISDGRDNSLRGVGDRLYISAGGVVPGDSGGAVVDYAGKLCSIVQGVLGNGLGYGSPTPVIESFIEPFLKKKNVDEKKP